jgi:hypothetical protein
MLCVLSPAFAGDKESRSFSNLDLGKYEKSNDSQPSDKSGQIKSADTSNEDQQNNMRAEQKLKRYAVRYAGVARRIIIPVTFNNTLTVPMLLDTGAPGMHISLKLASKLGILDNDDSKLWITAGGIGGTTPAIFTVIDSIKVGEMEDHFIPTVISKSIFQGFEGLIGMDFMGNYSMRVDTMNRVVIFEELPKSASMPAGHNEMWWRSTFHNFKSMKTIWRKYKDEVSGISVYTEKQKKMKMFVEDQYDKADDLFNRLNGYASQNSVPLEWR